MKTAKKITVEWQYLCKFSTEILALTVQDTKSIARYNLAIGVVKKSIMKSEFALFYVFLINGIIEIMMEIRMK